MSKKEKEEFAIVSKIDGFDALAKEVSQRGDEQKAALISVAIHSIHIGALISDFVVRAELRMAVDDYNANRQKQKLGGAPRKYHCVVAERLQAAGVQLTKKWMEGCYRDFETLVALGYTRAAIDSMTPGEAAKLIKEQKLLPAAFTVDETPEIEAPNGKRPTFKDILANVVAKLDSISSKGGELALKNSKNRELLAAAIEDWFAKNGCKCSIALKP